jgi:hypothetical protein
MPTFLDTRGKSKLAIAICARCGSKCAYADLIEDGNIAGFYVCSEECRDPIDPYRLAPRQQEDISLSHPRPDTPVTDFGITALFGPDQLNPIVGGAELLPSPVTGLGPARPWQPDTWYNKGDTITPQNVDADTTVLPQVWLVCLGSGWSGTEPPVWPAQTGVYFREADG